MSDWKTLSSKVMYETPWIKVRRDEVVNHAGKPLTYSVVDLRHPSVFIVAMNSYGEILLQKNYRYTIDQTIWELPAGHSEGQEPVEAAKRELLEETGLASSHWANLGRFYQSIGTANMPLFICLARDVQRKGTPTETIEQVEEQRFVSFNEIEAMIERGEIINAADLGALYLAKLHKKI